MSDPYAKISSIELYNFMVFEKERIDFDEFGVLNIKGYNDSGKSAILRAIAACMMDKFKNKQIKFIRSGESYFRIVLSFKDGVSILREKYLNGQSLYEMYKGEELIYTTRQGDKLSRVEAVPEIIENYLGLCKTPKGFLNYQSCDDPLWLIQTTGSENYEAFHTVLKSEELSKASQLANEERNRLTRELSELDRAVSSLQYTLDDLQGIDEEFLALLKEKEVYAEEFDRAKISLESILEQYRKLIPLEKQSKTPRIGTIDGTKLVRLCEIEKYMCELKKLEKLTPKLSKIAGFERLNELRKLYVLCASLEKVKESISVPKVDKVSEEKLVRISHLYSLLGSLGGLKVHREIKRVGLGRLAMLNSLKSQIKKIKDINATIEGDLQKEKVMSDQLDSLVKEANSQGFYYEKCDSCGSYVAIAV